MTQFAAYQVSLNCDKWCLSLVNDGVISLKGGGYCTAIIHRPPQNREMKSLIKREGSAINSKGSRPIRKVAFTLLLAPAARNKPTQYAVTPFTNFCGVKS